MTRAALPLADAPSLGSAARRTTLVRGTLALALVLVSVAAVQAARGGRVDEASVLPRGANAIVVLDVSASISTETYSRIGTALRQLVASNGRFGLVLFSGTAYEALPPGTPATELRPLIRFFTLTRPAGEEFLPTFPVNPWAQSFSAGTKISAGLELAREIVARDRIERPAVLLISDLADDPGDVAPLTASLLAYRRADLPLRVVALNPTPEDQAFFRRLLPRGTPIAQAPSVAQEGEQHAAFPSRLAALAVFLLALLAANELFGARLTWRERPA